MKVICIARLCESVLGVHRYMELSVLSDSSLRAGCSGGCPGFYLNPKGDYDVRVSLKKSGFLCLITGFDGKAEGF